MSRRKEDIIRVSIELFNEKGCLNISTRHISEKLGISVGNLYYYFSNKEDILIAIFKQYTNALLKSIYTFDFSNDSPFPIKEFLIHFQKLDQKYKFLNLELNSIILSFPRFKLMMKIFLNDEFDLRKKIINHQIKHGYIINLNKNEINYLISNARILAISSNGYWNILYDNPINNIEKVALNIFYFLRPYLTQKACSDEDLNQLEKQLHNYRKTGEENEKI